MGIFAPFGYIKNKIVEPSIVYDVDAQNFFTATSITNVGLQIAVNDFVIALKNTGSLWTDMRQILPFVTDTTDTTLMGTQFSVNLKNTGSLNPTLVNGVGVSNENGYFSNAASTRYINTNVNPTSVFGNGSDYSVNIYTTSTGQAGDVYDWGGFSNNSFYSYFIVGRSLSAGNTQKLMALRPNTFAQATSAAAAGFYSARYNQTLSPVSVIRLNGVTIGTAGAGAANFFNNNAFFGGQSNNGNPANISTKQYQMLAVGRGLTDTQSNSLNTIVQDFQQAVDTAMGTNRKV